jgi:hypothetical protein
MSRGLLIGLAVLWVGIGLYALRDFLQKHRKDFSKRK